MYPVSVSILYLLPTTVITKNTFPQNEGYPQVLCTAIVAGTVELLNEAANDNLYFYEMKPIVKAEKDPRFSKEKFEPTPKRFAPVSTEKRLATRQVLFGPLAHTVSEAKSWR